MDRISKGGSAVVVTGESAQGTDEGSELALKWGNQPIIVYVCDDAAGCEGFDKLEEVVLKDEKVALAMKAFRTVKMHPDHAAAEPVLAGKGKSVPRMLLVEPTQMKVSVLEQGKLKASGLFSEMKKIAGRLYEEKLDDLVKAHLKLLTEQDQMVNADKVLSDKLARVSGSGAKGEREAAQIKQERDVLQASMRALAEKQKAHWKLTPKDKKSA